MTIEEYLSSEDRDIQDIGFALLNNSDLEASEKCSILRSLDFSEKTNKKYDPNNSSIQSISECYKYILNPRRFEVLPDGTIVNQSCYKAPKQSYSFGIMDISSPTCK